jgi:hypothetical protein
MLRFSCRYLAHCNTLSTRTKIPSQKKIIKIYCRFVQIFNCFTLRNVISKVSLRHLQSQTTINICTLVIFFRRRSTANQTHDHESDEDDADDEKSRKSAKKSTNVSKDFKIPKKKAANQPPPSTETAANPLGSPLRTEKKFEQVEDALEAMFADLTGMLQRKNNVAFP